MSKLQLTLFSQIFLIIVIFISIQSCGSEDSAVNPPVTGEVLLAEVSGDSVGVNSGSSSKSLSITGSTLNFSDRDSARITFYYSGENNTSTQPMTIFYTTGPTENIIYNAVNLNITPAEQYADITFASPKVNQFFSYRITTTSAGSSFFKFKDLKIYKK